MKKHIITILLLIFTLLPASADYTTTNTFVIDADTTMAIVISGTLSSSIDGETGALSTPLNINFNITTNQADNNVILRAFVLDSTGTKQSAFYCLGSGNKISETMHLVFGDYATGHNPTGASINNCKQVISTAINNSDAIAYPGIVRINNGGRIAYHANGGTGYFSSIILPGNTNLNLTLATTPKLGTYDVSTALDEPDDYKVEIYLDNIP